MASLVDTIADPAKKKAVIDDCVILLDKEVASKGGLRGRLVKGAFKTVKSFKPGIIPMSLNALLDDFAAKVDPFWLDCQKSQQNPRAYFDRRKSEVANALLEITDARAKVSQHRVLVKAYNTLRGTAVDHIGAAMPRFSQLLVKHAS